MPGRRVAPGHTGEISERAGEFREDPSAGAAWCPVILLLGWKLTLLGTKGGPLLWAEQRKGKGSSGFIPRNDTKVTVPVKFNFIPDILN